MLRTAKDCLRIREEKLKIFNKSQEEIKGQMKLIESKVMNANIGHRTKYIDIGNVGKLFIKSNKSRGKYPIGVTLHKGCNNFCSRCSILDENNNIIRKEIGYFKTIEEAFLAYKTFKEQYIKQVADEYKDKIPKKLYDAMYNYKVEITD